MKNIRIRSLDIDDDDDDGDNDDTENKNKESKKQLHHKRQRKSYSSCEHATKRCLNINNKKILNNSSLLIDFSLKTISCIIMP